MNKILLAPVVIGFSLLFGGMAEAATAHVNVTVQGTITNNAVPVDAAAVHVICTTAGHQSTSDVVSSSTGHYSTTFFAENCPNGAPVQVTASSPQGTNTKNGVMGTPTSNETTVNVDLADTPPPINVPEYGLLTTGVAVSGAAVVVAAIRRRQSA